MKTLEDVLQEISPTPDPDFVADMERRMQQGFPGRSRTRLLPPVPLPTLRPRALAGVAAGAVLALLVTVSLVGGNGERQRDVAAGRFASGSEASSGGGGAPTAQDDAVIQSAPAPDARVAPGAPERRVERSAQLTLADDPSEFDRLADAIFRMADRRDGFVLRSSFTEGDDGPSSGFFELRVPSAQLAETLNELSRLATVRARSESGADVTGPFVSLRERLRTARAERKSLLRRLERAETGRAAEAIRQQLTLITQEITNMRGALRGMRERTELATVSVELVDEDAGAASGETDEAIDDAVGSLEDILNFLIRALGVLLPVGVTALLVWLGASYARRRARERALA